MIQAPSTPGQFRYYYGGFDLISDVGLEHLPVARATDTGRYLKVYATMDCGTWDDVAPADALFAWTGRFGLSVYRRSDGWLFRARDGIAFAVDGSGTTITYLSKGSRWDDDAAEMLVHRVLPRVVQLHDSHVVHGAVVAREGEAVVLVGASGSGKSTLAAYLSHCRGWSFMSDDACVLRAEHRAVVAYATSAGVSLFDDSTDHVRLTRSGRERKVARGVKQVCTPPAPRGAHCAQIGSILMLAPSAEDTLPGSVAVQPLTSVERVICLDPHMICLNPADMAARRRRLYFLGGVAERLPVCVLRYPRSFDSLAAVADLIESHEVTGRCAAQ